jgi:hypothetical protein
VIARLEERREKEEGVLGEIGLLKKSFLFNSFVL